MDATSPLSKVAEFVRIWIELEKAMSTSIHPKSDDFGYLTTLATIADFKTEADHALVYWQAPSRPRAYSP